MPEKDPVTNTFRVLPSVLSSDFCRLGDQIESLREKGCRLLHLDIMDGHFVPNMTFGPPVVKCLAERFDVGFDVHLMVTDPDAWTEAFHFPNTRCITVHAEAGYHLHRSLQKIRDRGILAGLALNPATPPDVLEYLWPSLDLVLIMTVNPGFGGQAFIESCREKIDRVRNLIDERTGGRVILEIDGGVGLKNIEDLVRRGVQWVVTGNALFGADDPAVRFQELQELGTKIWAERAS